MGVVSADAAPSRNHPTAGFRMKCPFASSFLWDRARFRGPDLGRVLGDGAIAGELPGAGDIQNRFVRPRIALCVEFAKPLIRIEVRFEVGEVHVVVAMLKQRVMNGGENPWLIVTEI